MGKLREFLKKLNVGQRLFVVCYVLFLLWLIWNALTYDSGYQDPDFLPKATTGEILLSFTVMVLLGVAIFFFLIPSGKRIQNPNGVKWWQPEFTIAEIVADIYRIGFGITWITLFLAGYAYAIIEYGFFLGLGLGWIPAVFCALIGALLWPLFVIGVIVLYNLFPDEASALLALMAELIGELLK